MGNKKEQPNIDQVPGMDNYELIVVDVRYLNEGGIKTRMPARTKDGEEAIKKLIAAGIQPFVGLRIAIERFHYESLLPFEFKWEISSICWIIDHNNNQKPVLLIELETFS